ncbi:MAG: zinc ABC transporter substrate-binding protein [Treponemataceae bacterium]
MSRRIRFSIASAAILLVATTLSCGGTSKEQTTSDKPTVAVSVLPQSYFVARIAGDRVSVLTLVGPGQSPHSYEPSPQQMTRLSKTALWITTAVEFENALKPKVSSLYPKLKIADGTKGIVLRSLEAHSHETESEPKGDEKHEQEGGPDPHVWLGKQGAKTMSAIIRDELSALMPSYAAEFGANYDAFAKEVDALFAELALSLAPIKGKPVFVYHPAFGYLLDEFGLEQEAVETGGKEPTAKALSSLVREAKADGAKVIFVQTQFPVAAAKTVAEAIGGAVVPIDDLDPDWAANIRRIGEALKAGVR